MANTYLVKKNPALPCSDENWLIMNYSEYKEWLNTPDGVSRKIHFGKIFQVDKNDSTIYIECEEKEQKKCKRIADEQYYRKTVRKEVGYKLIPYQELTQEETVSGEEVIPDTEINIEEDAMKRLEIEYLRKALDCLSKDEKELLYRIYLSESPVSRREYAKQIGLSHRTVNYRVELVLKKLRNMLS